ncbi:MAG: hypothetical protein ACLGHT_09755 [Acidimicrobiia bacterium]
MKLAHDPMGRDPLGESEDARRRRTLSEQIDKAVEGHLTDELLGRLVKQALQLRYYGAEDDRLVRTINEMVDRYTRKLIIDWIKDHEDELYDGVEEQLEKVHLPKLGAAIVDEFMKEHSQ